MSTNQAAVAGIKRKLDDSNDTLPSKRAKVTKDFVHPDDVEDDALTSGAKKPKEDRPPGGRCISAPPANWTPRAGATTTVYQDISKIDKNDPWNDPSAKGVRLVYAGAGNGGTDLAVLMQDPCITNSNDDELHKHFKMINTLMIATKDPKRLTEATGEAAAGIAMLRTHAAAKMQWGVHMHSGAGIDQIWKQDAQGSSKATYFIVESKGVGAALTLKTFGPPAEIAEQMSLGWVLDNLVRMHRNKHKIATEILTELGLYEVYKPKEPNKPQTNDGYYFFYGGAGKTYYACGFAPDKKKASLKGVTATATWQSQDGLHFTVVEKDYDSELNSSTAIKERLMSTK